MSAASPPDDSSPATLRRQSAADSADHLSNMRDPDETELICLAWLRRSLADFYVQDRALLRYQVGEWGLTFRIGLHLARHAVGGWDVDAEYDRQGTGGDLKARSSDSIMRPDLIVHRRGLRGSRNNLLFLEVKRRWRLAAGSYEDVDKARRAVLTHEYQVGVALSLGTTRAPFLPIWTVFVHAPSPSSTYRVIAQGETVFGETELASLLAEAP